MQRLGSIRVSWFLQLGQQSARKPNVIIISYPCHKIKKAAINSCCEHGTPDENCGFRFP
jgi:hypothetical protein